jgi:copper oxidase (laccase) domain-containing protein
MSTTTTRSTTKTTTSTYPRSSSRAHGQRGPSQQIVQALYRQRVGGRLAVAVATEVSDGDVHPRRVDPAVLIERQIRVARHRWVMLREAHGVEVIHIGATASPDADGWPLAGVGDVLVTAEPDVPIAIWAADCAPIAIFGAAGTTVGIHAGWRGLAAGIIDVGIAQLAALGEQPVVAVLGPVIHPCCYEFGDDDLCLVARGIAVDPEHIAGRTADGALALDVPAAVRSALERRGVAVVGTGSCTGCGGRWFSHRCRRDEGRHALVAWTQVPQQDPAPPRGAEVGGAR